MAAFEQLNGMASQDRAGDGCHGEDASSAGAGAGASIGRQLPYRRRVLRVSDPSCPVPRRTCGRGGEEV